MADYTPEHTPEPWKNDGWDNFGEDLEPVIVLEASSRTIIAMVYTDKNTWEGASADKECIANAQRIVDCVNACEGIANPEAAVEAMVKALRFYADRLAFTHLDGECSAMCSDEGDIARDAVAKAILGS